MKRRHLYGLILIIVFTVFCGFVFSQSLTPYVSFKEAMEKNGSVQVKGVLLSSKINSINDGHGITFRLEDEEGTIVTVVYPGLKPENLEHSTSVVVIGSYSKEEEVFNAEKILVKCPSKYQAEEVNQ